MGWVLLDDLVRRKEEHGPDEALHWRDELGDPIVLGVPACEPEACRLSLVGCILYEARRCIYVNYGLAVCKSGLAVCKSVEDGTSVSLGD